MDFELQTHVARGFRERLIGLAWSRSPRAAALLLPRCASVHTFAMRFPIDLYWLLPSGGVARVGQCGRSWLDAAGDIVRVDHGVRPWRVARCRGARSVIEVPALAG